MPSPRPKLRRLLVPLLVLAPATASAQVTRRVSSEPECATCRIEFKRLAVVGNSGGVSLQRESNLAVDSQGRMIVGPTYTPGEVVLYDRTGSLVRRSGRSGQGPGEFNRIDRIRVGPGDSVHVFDGPRHTVLAPGLGAFAATLNLPMSPNDLAILADGRIVISQMVSNAAGIGEPLHVTSPRGDKLVRSLGGRDPWKPMQIYRGLRAVAPASRNRIWSARIPEYRLELWTPEGENPLALVRDARWFQPWTEEDLPTPMDGLKRPRVTAVAEDAQGRVWVIALVPNPGWKVPQTRGREIPTSEVDSNQMFNTMIEVIDPQRGRLISSATHPGTVIGFLGAGDVVYTRREDADGNTLIDVWRVRLTTGNPARVGR